MCSIYFIIIKNLSHSHYSDWYRHWDLKGIFSLQNIPLLGSPSCLIEQWHIFSCSVIWVFGELIPTSAKSYPPPPQPLPPPYFSASPPRHLQSRLVSPPQSSPSHGVPGVGREAPESTMPLCASGEVCEEPASAASSSSSPSSQAAVDTQTGPASRWIPPVNPTCLAAWSSPASTHLIKYMTRPPPSPSPWSVKFVSPPIQPPPTPAGAPHITLPKNPQEEYFFFFFYGWKDRWRLCISMGIFEQRLLRSDCNHHKQIQ